MFLKPKNVIHSEEGKTTCFFVCPVCMQEVGIEVNTADWEKRQSGSMANDCFAGLEAADKELFVSGICGVCMDNIDEQKQSHS